jgi:hypothetical protein
MRLPRLRLRAGEGLPPQDALRELVMTDPNGVAVAYGWTTGPDHWLQVPEIGTFHFTPGSDEVTAVPVAAASVDSVEHAYRSIALPLALQVSGFEALHASAVRTEEGVVAFCALSGTGKSTVAYGLSARGHTLWGDDAVVFEASESGRVLTHPIPFAPGLRGDAHSLFEDGNCMAERARVASDEPHRLRAVFVMERSDDMVDAVEIVRQSAADALAGLIPHAHGFNLADYERKRRTLESYLVLATQVPVLEMRFRPGLDRLEAVLDGVETWMAEA